MSDHDDRIRELEQMTFNNTVNFEVLLDLLIKAKIVSEDQFMTAKQALEQQILEAQRQQGGSGPVPQVGD